MIATSEQERYQLYLCSREWAERRRRVMARCGGVCERCRGGAASHVHHLTYIRKYAERPEDLQATCEPCHEFIHGKCDRDPLSQVPPRLFDRTIKSVYLAGKITGDPWRRQILHESLYSVSSWEDGWFRPKAVKVPTTGYLLDYRGPFWIDVGYGHGELIDNDGDHAFGSRIQEHKGYRCETNRFVVRQRSFFGVVESDLVFAWIDGLDCYGTLAEIAFAYAEEMRTGKGPVIVIAHPPDFDPSDVWFVYGMGQGQYLLSMPPQATPGAAWRRLWEARP